MQTSQPSKGTLDQYTIIKTLGKGISAKVKLARTADNQEFALKIFDKSNPVNDETAMKTLKAEVDVYGQLKHPNMVQLVSFCDDAVYKKNNGQEKRVAYMVLELCTQGELFDFVALKHFSEKQCRYFFRTMLHVLHSVHSKGYAHRDLKPENIMVDGDFNLKLADFGFAAPVQGRTGQGFLSTPLGTYSYMAPEQLVKEPYQGHVVDLFALGVILFILYSGHPPFATAHQSDSYYKLISQNRADLFWKFHEKQHEAGFFSPEFKDLMTSMFQTMSQQRLSLADIVGHPWLQGEIATQAEIQQEFAERKQLITQQRAQEQAQQSTRQETASRRQGARRGDNINGRVFMSEEDCQQVSELPENAVVLKLDTYVHVGNNKTTQLYSTYEPSHIFAQLYSYLKDRDCKVDLRENKWKMVFELHKEQTKEEAEAGVPVDGFQAQVKIEVIDANSVCVDFQRLSGNHWCFLSTFREIQKALKDLNDACVKF